MEGELPAMKVSGSEAPLPPTARPGGPRLQRWLVAIVFGIAVYALLLVIADVRELRAVAVGFQPMAFVVALGLALLAFGLRAARWFVYLRRLRVWGVPGPDPISFREALGMSLATGKAGHAVKSYYLNQRTGMPLSMSIPAGLAERMSDVIAIVILLLVGLFFGPKFGLASGLVASAFLVLCLLVLRSERSGQIALGLLRRFPRAQAAAMHLERAHQNLRPMLHTRPLLVPITLGFLGFALEATAMRVLAGGLGLGLSWVECAFVLGAADVAGTLSLLPGGLGVVDGGIVVLLTFLDVALAPATALALLTRVVTLWLGGGLDLVSFVLLRGLKPPGKASKGPPASAPR